jgi:hypothetical protein
VTRGRPTTAWSGDPEMQALADVAHRLEEVAAERDRLLAERDRLARALFARGATIAQIAVRAGVSDSFMSRRVHDRTPKPWPPRQATSPEASPRP